MPEALPIIEISHEPFGIMLAAIAAKAFLPSVLSADISGMKNPILKTGVGIGQAMEVIGAWRLSAGDTVGAGIGYFGGRVMSLASEAFDKASRLAKKIP